MKLSKAKRRNLLKLAEYLESLPVNYRHFEMAIFMGGDEEDIREYARHNGGVDNCGTVACAIGHGPSAGFLFPKNQKSTLWFENGDPDWHEYSARYFIDYDRDDASWEWCFSNQWSSVDNHHWGAAARIRYLLAGRKVPTDNDGYHWASADHVELYREFRKKGERA